MENTGISIHFLLTILALAKFAACSTWVTSPRFRQNLGSNKELALRKRPQGCSIQGRWNKMDDIRVLFLSGTNRIMVYVGLALSI